MKKYILLLTVFLILGSITLYAQKYEAVKLGKVDLYINSQTNLGGSNRAYVQIQLPNNTVSWTYSFTTTTNQNSPIFDLTKYAANYISGGISNAVLNFTGVPKGEVPCNVYLLDANNINPFLNYQRFTYYNSGTNLNYLYGTFNNTWPNQGLFYLGLENPGYFNGIYVSIEIVAIVKR